METTIAKNAKLHVVWDDEHTNCFRVFKGSEKHPTFTASADDIHEWSDAPKSIQDRALRQMRAAGRTGSPQMVAGDKVMGPVFCLCSDDIVARVRELIPAARAAAAEREAARVAEEQARQAEFERRQAEARAACPDGYEACTTGRWFDGLLACVAADGTTVDQWDSIDDHKCGIVYVRHELLEEQRASDAKAREFAARRQAEKEAKAAADTKHEAECLQQARETGERIAIRSYSVPCRDPHEECNVDIATVWAMPDGTKQTTYRHTW